LGDIETYNCKSCGAPITAYKMKCDYCGGLLKWGNGIYSATISCISGYLNVPLETNNTHGHPVQVPIWMAEIYDASNGSNIAHSDVAPFAEACRELNENIDKDVAQRLLRGTPKDTP
jgi:hypothetical protein